MQFKFPSNSYNMALKQVTQMNNDSSFYMKLSKSEYDVISTYLKQPKRILELGCGLGRMSVFLNWMLADKSIHYTLADSTSEHFPEKIKYGWNPESIFYNNLNQTSEFCKLNDLTNYDILDLQTDKLNKLFDIDLVISFLSVGFHYPIEMYLDVLNKITTKDCTMIFGVRKTKYNIEYFKNIFSNVIIINQPNIEIKEDILILENRL